MYRYTGTAVLLCSRAVQLLPGILYSSRIVLCCTCTVLLYCCTVLYCTVCAVMYCTRTAVLYLSRYVRAFLFWYLLFLLYIISASFPGRYTATINNTRVKCKEKSFYFHFDESSTYWHRFWKSIEKKSRASNHEDSERR